MKPEIKTLRLQNSEVKFIKMTLKKGKEYFSGQNFNQCTNEYYMENQSFIVHYNSVMKVWIIEEK